MPKGRIQGRYIRKCTSDEQTVKTAAVGVETAFNDEAVSVDVSPFPSSFLTLLCEV